MPLPPNSCPVCGRRIRRNDTEAFSKHLAKCGRKRRAKHKAKKKEVRG